MNILEFLKNGSGIHIKESQKGSFTKYCNGKVTNECIQRGKNSPDPKIRKKATFAQNARRWKHAKGGIIKAENGISTSLLELLPVYGTYKDYERFKGNPNWKTGTSLGISALGDAATLTGIGTIIKGVSTINKAKKVLGTAGKAANIARLNVWKSASKLKRESDAVNSLTLMDAPINKILERQTSKNLALLNFKQALKNDENVLKFYLSAGNNPAFNFKISEFAPLIYTNPGFHATSQTVQSRKKGGQLIKAEEGTKFLSKQWFQNTGLKVNNFLSSDVGKFAVNAGQQIYSNISSGVKLAETKDRLQKWKQAYVNSIEPKDFSLQVAEEERLIKLANPDYNISPIVSAYKENILATQAANKAKQKASQEADWIIMLQLLNLNESSTGGGFGNLLTEGLGLAGQFLSSKKSNNTGTTNLSTSLNGSPNTYNVFLNNTYTLPSLKTPVLTAPTIPTKYMTV